MSTVFTRSLKKNLQKVSADGDAVHCVLCRGEIWPGEVYFQLDGQRVCEACLERYARVYFAPQRRRLGRNTTEGGSAE